ncbi:hypothetical protein SODALDRAFT_316732 [Sodiomyces alkalinus F11]|uniref:Protein kinase domain-containing protein n=1 Tax=Sodiomyces alkalinus (strain CBS 110278 / VKM F-3762 / F11) TaxID=1314773 RepID=A0A3N2PLE5_SODAK|nr:hypothetical protein SODALDRAFT_316732 [Sodiomyces alkalinus F11]ROT35348.1 hypothetical protein SODALDRAFT_316732 [Sodiomyces alkalinus F11]
MSDAKRHTRFIEDSPLDAYGAQQVAGRSTRKPTQRHSRFPVRPTIRREGRDLVPVLTGSPWKHYDTKYRIHLGYSFGVVTARKSHETSMIRSITGQNTDEQIQYLRQICHPNIVAALEIYSCPKEGCFLLSEFMPTTLRHLCRAPIYPSEQQLSSILHQVLSGAMFLLESGLVHEELSVANVQVNLEGEVKIGNVERCRKGGDTFKLLESFGRLTMKLMDKEKAEDAVPGLTYPEDWSQEAFDMFTMANSKPDIKDLLCHPFMLRREQKELKWLVHSVLITAYHEREET